MAQVSAQASEAGMVFGRSWLKFRLKTLGVGRTLVDLIGIRWGTDGVKNGLSLAQVRLKRRKQNNVRSTLDNFWLRLLGVGMTLVDLIGHI